MSDPIGWRADISQAVDYALPTDMSWPADAPGQVIIEAWFGISAQPILRWLPGEASVEEAVIFRTLTTRFESGKEQRRAKGTAKRSWNVRWRRAQVDADTLWAFFIARNGPAEPFLWYNEIDDETYLVRFPAMMSRRVLWEMVYETGLELVEVV